MFRAVDHRSTRAPRAVRAEHHTTFGNWSATRLIAEGRWACVYAARPAQGPADRTADYAIKTLKAPCGDMDAAERMLRREAWLGQRIVHPHLAPVLACGEQEGRPYIVMPLIAGATLESMIEQQSPLSAPLAFWIARQSASALAALHEQGWIHGDVKPANIVVSQLAHATLIDLGFARPIERSGRTAPGPVLGTPAYSPPELYTSTVAASGRSDVYSLGVALFRALTGELPFPYADRQELAAAHLTACAPDPRRMAPQLSNRTVRLLRALLAKEPLRRPTAQELVDWLIDLEIDTLEECAPA